MLKFSGFADLTSCRGSVAPPGGGDERAKEVKTPPQRSTTTTRKGPSAECLSWGTYALDASRRQRLDAQTRSTDGARATT